MTIKKLKGLKQKRTDSRKHSSKTVIQIFYPCLMKIVRKHTKVSLTRILSNTSHTLTPPDFILQGLQKFATRKYISYFCPQFLATMKEKFCSNTLYFKHTLPFTPITSQLIYIEDKYNAPINDLIQQNLHSMQIHLQKYGIELCYLPQQSQLFSTEKYINYFSPYLKSKKPHQIESTCLNAYLKQGEEVKPCFIIYTGKADCNFYQFDFFPLNGTETDFHKQFECIVKKFYKAQFEEFETVRYSTIGDIEDVELKESELERKCLHFRQSVQFRKKEYVADEAFSVEVLNLMQDVRNKLAQLRQYGVNEMVLQRLLASEIQLSRLHITSQNHIFLPDYNNREIKMTPLVKAVFFLFLRHPEGIAFKTLPDYRTELIEIYNHLTGRQNMEQVIQSIINVTNPYSNSINEKCARIREAFVREFDDRLAQYYYITGSRGHKKSIQLNRELVEWEIAL